MALPRTEAETLDRLYQRLLRRRKADRRHYEYVRLERVVEQIGMAVPPELRRFLVLLGWPRVVVDTIRDRQQERAYLMAGAEEADETLQRIATDNNLTAQLKLWRQDYLTYGRGFLSVGPRGEDGRARVRVESPKVMELEADPYGEKATAAARFIEPRDAFGALLPRHATLYLDGVTKIVERDGNRWNEVQVFETGRPVPIVMHLNRGWSGELEGESELTEIIPLTDGAVRSITDMQVAQEAHGVPSIWATGVTQGDFVDPATGKPLSQFETYFDVVKMLTNPDGKWGQFTAADLENFETALRIYGIQAAIATGFPARDFGVTSANPASEGAVTADEIKLVRKVESKNEAEAVTLGWAMALAYEVATGDAVPENGVRVEYRNPATPTVAQREDALSKRRAAGVLSREGYWDELGWSEARKAKERAYFEREQFDPQLDALGERLNGVQL